MLAEVEMAGGAVVGVIVGDSGGMPGTAQVEMSSDLDTLLGQLLQDASGLEDAMQLIQAVRGSVAPQEVRLEQLEPELAPTPAKV
jgi:hypothetical protein